MPIPFSCPCGKKLLAKEEFAGRRMKCPACGTVLAIPNPAATETLAPPPPGAMPVVMLEDPALPVAPPPSPPVAATLNKETPPVFQMHPAERPATVPGPRAAAQAPPRGPSAACPDTLASQASAPWKNAEARRDGGARWHHGTRVESRRKLGLALLVLLVGGLGALWFFKDKAQAREQELARAFEAQAALLPTWDNGPDLNLIPREATGILSFRPQDIELPKKPGPIPRKTPLPQVLTLRLAEEQPYFYSVGLARVTIVRVPVPAAPPKGGAERLGRLVFLQTNQPIQQEKLRTFLSKETTIRTTSGATYHVSKATGKNKYPDAYYFPGGRLAVIGTAADLEHFIQHKSLSNEYATLRDTIVAANKDHQVVIGVIGQTTSGTPPRTQVHSRIDTATLDEGAKVVMDQFSHLDSQAEAEKQEQQVKEMLLKYRSTLREMTPPLPQKFKASESWKTHGELAVLMEPLLAVVMIVTEQRERAEPPDPPKTVELRKAMEHRVAVLDTIQVTRDQLRVHVRLTANAADAQEMVQLLVFPLARQATEWR